MNESIRRCEWAYQTPAMLRYHDEEWGRPVHDDGRLFEFLVLESAQAGLSWRTILDRRPHYRQAYAGFSAATVAQFTKEDVGRLLAPDSGIVRNRMKVESSIANARRFLAVQEQFGSFDAYLWRFVDGKPIQNEILRLDQLPAKSHESSLLSRDLRQRGFTFLGPVICYAFMQAVGLVNDHLIDCACREHCAKAD